MDRTIRDQAFWEHYLDERQGTFAFRCIRYSAVLDRLMLMGFHVRDSITDIGAGRQEFEQFLRSQGWQGCYTPIDGSIDGTDLDRWDPSHEDTFPDWMVAIEVIEHLHDPVRMVNVMKEFAIKGMVVTTPNPEVVDVLGMDRTHVTVVSPDDLAQMGLRYERATLFGTENDSLIGWRKR